MSDAQEIPISLSEDEWRIVLEAVTHYGHRLARRSQDRGIEVLRREKLVRVAGIIGDAVGAPSKKRFR